MLKGMTKLETACPGVDLVQFRHLKELRFVVEDEDNVQIINAYLRVACDTGDLVAAASLSFRDVKDIRIQGLNPPDMYVPGFDIVSIKEKGWERINFQVMDYEEDRIHFYARDAEVIEVLRL
jgi:hypothetical protein